ncbi:archease [Candidatus Latescibacterota bacterium]
MFYRYLENDTIADIAFQARGETLEDLFRAAADATINVMVEELDSIRAQEERTIHIEADGYDMLLVNFLQELIYYKDARQLILRPRKVNIVHENVQFTLDTECYGEEIDPKRHKLNVDVKAVTLYRFKVFQTSSGWEANVILDI